MLKRLGLAAAFVAALLGASLAANIPTIPSTTPLEAGQANANANLVIGNVNAYGPGLIAANLANSATTLTTIQTLFTATVLPPFMSPGHAVRVHAWGVNSADANVKTFTLGFGALTDAVVVTGSGNTWTVDCTVLQSAAAAQSSECHGVTGTTAVAAVTATGTVTTLNTPVNLTLSGTAATAGTMTLTGATVEIVQ